MEFVRIFHLVTLNAQILKNGGYIQDGAGLVSDSMISLSWTSKHTNIAVHVLNLE